MEIEVVNIISKGGLVVILMTTIYYLHTQYNNSIARFYERERDFYKEIEKRLDDILEEIEEWKKSK